MGERVVFDEDEDDDEDADEGSSSSKSKKDGECKHASKTSTEKESSREKKSKHSKKSAGKSSQKSEKGDRAQKKSKSPKQCADNDSNNNNSASVSSKLRSEASASGEKAALKKGGKKASHSDDIGITTAEGVRKRGSDKEKSKEERDKCGAAAVRRSPRLAPSACPAVPLRLCVCDFKLFVLILSGEYCVNYVLFFCFVC